MSLDATLLEKLAEWRPGSGRETLVVPASDGGWGVALTADRADDLSCLVWEVELRRDGPTADAVALRAWADAAATRAKGLLEALKVVEVDVGRNLAMLRSDAPTARGDDRHYYEILLGGTTAADVRRYRGSAAGGKREQVAFALTHEALAKLVGDMITSV